MACVARVIAAYEYRLSPFFAQLFSQAGALAVPGKALVRATAWTSNPAAQVFVGVIDTDANGNLVGTDLGMNQLTSTPALTKTWRIITALHESQTGYVRPFVQVAGGAGTDSKF